MSNPEIKARIQSFIDEHQYNVDFHAAAMEEKMEHLQRAAASCNIDAIEAIAASYRKSKTEHDRHGLSMMTLKGLLQTLYP